jgi:hypothetical protein
MVKSIINEMLEMTYPDDYYKNVIEPAKTGKGAVPSMGQMLMKSQPFKAVSLPFQEMMNPGKFGSFRSSGTPMARAITGPLSTAARGLLSAPAAGIMAALTPTPANADEANMTAEDFAALNQNIDVGTAPGIFDINQVGDPALNPGSVNAMGIDPFGVNEDLIDRGNPTGDPRIVSEEQGLSGGFVPTNRPNMRDIAGDINLNMTDLGNPLGDSRIASEEQGLSGFPGLGQVDRGFQDVLDAREARMNEIAMQQNPDYGQFFDAPAVNNSKQGINYDALGILGTIGGLLTGSTALRGLGMFGNYKSGRTGRALDAISSGLGSLGSKMSGFNRAMRGYNPVTGRTNTQSQYEAARDARRTQSRIDNMLARKAAGKSYSQKNLDRLTAEVNQGINQREAAALADPNKSTKTGIRTDIDVADGGAETGGGGKIVCTMMNERYGFGSFRNKIWMKFHEHHGPEYQKGYHAIFLPLVKIAKGEGKINTAVRKVLEHMGRHVTADMFKIMKGKKRDTLGRIYRAIFEPACHIIGKIKSALGRG